MPKKKIDQSITALPPHTVYAPEHIFWGLVVLAVALVLVIEFGLFRSNVLQLMSTTDGDVQSAREKFNTTIQGIGEQYERLSEPRRGIFEVPKTSVEAPAVETPKVEVPTSETPKK